MKIIKCLIVDDSTEIIKGITETLEKYSFIQTTSSTDYNNAYKRISEETFDLIFLDMHLGNDSGLDLIKNLNSLPPIIVISSYYEYAAETYRFDTVIDYVLKPIDEARLLKAIGRVMALNNSELKEETKEYCFLKVSRKATRFDFDTIDYIESTGANSKIYYNGKNQIVNESISDIEQILPKSFKRVHKSFIANLAKITSLSLKTIEIENSKIPIGVSYRPKLMSLLKIFN